MGDWIATPSEPGKLAHRCSYTRSPLALCGGRLNFCFAAAESVIRRIVVRSERKKLGGAMADEQGVAGRQRQVQSEICTV